MLFPFLFFCKNLLTLSKACKHSVLGLAVSVLGLP